MSPDLSIIIPCFNEEKNITIVLRQLEKIVKESEYFIEVVVVDGGSTDQTPKELQRIFHTLAPDNFKLILNSVRGGYGADIKQGLDLAKGEVLSWTHADMQTDPADILKAFELYKKNENFNIVVKGKRLNRRFTERFFTFGMQIAVLIFLKKYLDDINAQPKLFSKNFYERFVRYNAPNDFSLDLHLLYQAKINKYDILEVAVYFKKRIYGEAKGGGGFRTRIKLILRTFKYIIRLKNTIQER